MTIIQARRILVVEGHRDLHLTQALELPGLPATLVQDHQHLTQAYSQRVDIQDHKAR